MFLRTPTLLVIKEWGRIYSPNAIPPRVYRKAPDNVDERSKCSFCSSSDSVRTETKIVFGAEVIPAR